MIANSSPPTRQARSLAAQLLARGGGHPAQHQIALLVAVDVVQELEVVEVEHDQRQRAAVALGAIELVAQPLVEDAVVVQAR